MLLPQELKKKTFTRSMRGYEQSEVDEYINFLIEKYSEIYTQCDRYDKKLRLVAEHIHEMQSEEEAIKKLTISTQKLCDNMISEAKEKAAKEIEDAKIEAEKIISEAHERSDTAIRMIEKKSQEKIMATEKMANDLLLSARTRCANLLNEFKKDITNQKNALTEIRNITENFNSQIFSMYKEQIDNLGSKMPVLNIDLDNFSESKLLSEIMNDIKNDAEKIVNNEDWSAEINFDEGLDLLSPNRERLQKPADTQEKPENSESSDVQETLDMLEKTQTISKQQSYVNKESKNNNDDSSLKSTTTFNFAKPKTENESEDKTPSSYGNTDELRQIDDIDDMDTEEDDDSSDAAYDTDSQIYNNDNDDDNENNEEPPNNQKKRMGWFNFLKKDKNKQPSASSYEDDNYEDDDDDDDYYDDDDDDDDDYYGLGSSRDSGKKEADIFED